MTRYPLRKNINLIPIILIGFLICFLAFLILLAILNFKFHDPVLESISLTLAEDTKEISLLIIGAVIASLTGLFSSVAIMDVKTEQTRNNILIGFYYEIKELKERFQDIPTDNVSACSIYLQRTSRPIYSKNGLYFRLKEELFSLNKPFLESILEIYSKIIFVENSRKNIDLSRGESTFDKRTYNTILEIKIKIDAILLLLQNEIEEIET